MAPGGKLSSMGRFGDQDLTSLIYLTHCLDQVQDRCVMDPGCVPFPRLGERSFLFPRVSIMCLPARLLRSPPSTVCSPLGFSLSPGCCSVLLVYSSDEWPRQEANTFATKPHMGFQWVMTLSQAICLVNALSLLLVYIHRSVA